MRTAKVRLVGKVINREVIVRAAERVRNTSAPAAKAAEAVERYLAASPPSRVTPAFLAFIGETLELLEDVQRDLEEIKAEFNI